MDNDTVGNHVLQTTMPSNYPLKTPCFGHQPHTCKLQDEPINRGEIEEENHEKAQTNTWGACQVSTTLVPKTMKKPKQNTWGHVK